MHLRRRTNTRGFTGSGNISGVATRRWTIDRKKGGGDAAKAGQLFGFSHQTHLGLATLPTDRTACTLPSEEKGIGLVWTPLRS